MFTLFGFLFLTTAQKLDGFEFSQTDIREILYMASLYSGIPIAGDDTVYGKANFQFTGNNFEEAFESFLISERLYLDKSSDVWRVSRVRFLKEDMSFFLDASDVKPSVLVEKISSFFKTEITFDSLPENFISLHTSGQNAKDFVFSLLRQLGNDFECSADSDFIHIKRNVAQFNQGEFAFSSADKISVLRLGEADEYSLDIENANALDAIEKLCVLAEKEFLFTQDNSTKIRRMVFNRKNFKESLDILCKASETEYIMLDQTVCIVPRSNPKTNLKESGKVWKKYTAKFCEAQELADVLEKTFGKLDFVFADGNSFLCFAREDVQAQLESAILEFDVQKKMRTVKLKFIKTQDLLLHLPSALNAQDFICTTQEDVFFFSGTDAQFEILTDALKTLDVPQKRISYDLLVVQYQGSEAHDFDVSLSAKKLSFGDRNGISALLGSVLDFKLDVIAAFGLEFASSLQAAINENRARGFADTTLQGVSGGTINFQNTNTYRYRDNNVDPETGKPVYSGVTKEIASGLKIDVTGWVSGDGMITSKVSASVSRQGTDLSNTTGNPPPTSEKLITTEVVGKSGEAVILSGLIQSEEDFSQKRVPFISKIPILGWLFKNQSKSKEKTELVIYLVPHYKDFSLQTENKNETLDVQEIFKSVLKSLVQGDSDE